MIYSVKGELTYWEAGLAVVECGGVGYACRTTMNTLAKIRELDEVKLYTYLHVTENSLDLFGFADNAELAAFKQLISVSGVGPKAALSVLSDITPTKLVLCISSGDFKTLTKSPGIGAKIAQRIILELKDKVAKEQKINAKDLQSVSVFSGDNFTEALTALQTLGFSPAQCGAALSGADPASTVEELIKFGLKNLA